MTKQYFHKAREIKKVVLDPMSAEEVSELILKHRPKEIFCEQWSKKDVFIVITEYDNEGGFMFYCNGHADKTPEYSNPTLLYAQYKHYWQDFHFNYKDADDAWEDFRAGAYEAWKKNNPNDQIHK